jgi:D-alanyl-lipoteichoic acid acyltransferase DltB (MBOAT superfamily)
MLFNSYEFIFGLLPAAFIAWALLLRGGWRAAATVALMAASLFFYGWWNPGYVLLILGSIGFNYAVGTLLERRAAGGRSSAWLLALGVAVNLSLLGYYKYAAFLVDNWNAATGAGLDVPHVVLPLAISFFTFHQIAYLVDAWHGETRGSTLPQYAAFVTFFPQLIAGPIVRYREMIPQLKAVGPGTVTAEGVATGACFFITGLFKKVVIADNVAPFSTAVFSAADAGQAVSPAMAWLGVLAYTAQLYFDFSGYADMAVGAGRMFGLRLPLNFNSPYRAGSLTDFWRRWHMTLSRFLRDYLYIPLGGNRKGVVRQHVNLFVTMLLGGLWHGAGWNFVIWGGLHGAALVVHHAWQSARGPRAGPGSAAGRAAGWLLTMLVVVAGWALFRATTTGGALAILSGMAGFGPASMALAPVEDVALGWALVATALAIAFFCPNSQQLLDREPFGASEALPHAPVRLALSGWTAAGYGALLFACLASMSDVSEFLYFQF